MSSVEVFKDLAIILVAAKFCGIAARRLHAPQVVGEIVAGLLIGPSIFGVVKQTEFLGMMAEIGVILLMFSAGLETNLKDLIKTGPKALLIACAGVAVPLAGGTLLYTAFYGAQPWGSEGFYKAVFVGVIMTATSVSITVETLREIGRLKGNVGTTIMGAAIIDDVIGIIVLTFVIGFKNPASRPMTVVMNTVLFFLFSGVAGFIFYHMFCWLNARYPHTRRIPILGLAFCLFLAYAAETYFGIADITGAYVAGIVLCSLSDSEYIAQKMDINSYILFAPIFFASIGLKTNVDNVTAEIIVFSAAFVLVALVTKIIGCGLMARVCGFTGEESLKVGAGMMTRGEVALIVAQKGLAVGMLTSVYFTSVIFLIIVSSVLTPILLKILYAKSDAANSSVLSYSPSPL